MTARKQKQAHEGIHSFEMALYHAVHDHRPGGLPVIAAMMGVDAGTLSKKLNINQDSHRLHVGEVRQIISLTKDKRILDTIASEMGAVWFFEEEMPVIAGDLDLLKTSNDVIEAAMQLVREFQTSLSDGDINHVEKARLKEKRLKLLSAAKMLTELAKQYEREDMRV